MAIVEIGNKKRRDLLKDGKYRAFPPRLIAYADANRNNTDYRWYDWDRRTLDYVKANRQGVLQEDENYLLEDPQWINKQKKSIQVRFKQEELKQDTWIKLPAYATGDMFAVAASVLASPFISTLIKYPQGGNPPNSMLHFFEEALMSRLEQGAGGTYQIKVNGLVKVLCQPQNSNNPQGDKLPVSYATTFTGMYFDKHVRSKMNEALGDRNGAEYQNLGRWLASRHFPADLRQRKILIFWMRFSGANGGAHPEQDSSFTFLNQVVSQFVQGNTILVIAGDRTAKGRKKIAAHVSAHQGQVFDFTEFWKSRGAIGWGGNSRFGQIRLYDYIKAKAGAVRHIGARSGNLEGMALLGQKVTYMDQRDSIGAHRMEAYTRHDAQAQRADRIGYNRFELQQPLSLTGKFVNACMVYLTGDAETCRDIIRVSANANLMAQLTLASKSRPKNKTFYRAITKLMTAQRHLPDGNVAVRILNKLVKLKLLAPGVQNSRYPEGLETGDAQRAMYLFATLAVKCKKDQASAATKSQLRGMSNVELQHLGQVLNE